MRVVASIAVICLWIQIFFWFRLFDSLAQYVDLIIQTVSDIRNFMTVLLAIVGMFMSGFYMIELNRAATDSDNLFEEINDDGSLYTNGLINQYFLLLGDFNGNGLYRSSEGY